MKRLLYIWIFMLPVLLWAQGQGVQFAPKGGVATWKGTDVTSNLSPVAGMELGYTIRWRVMQDMHLGMRLGAGASYMTCTLKGDIQDQYDRQDYLRNTLQYTTTANVEEKHQQLNVEIPLLFSMRACGFVLNAGPKMLLVMNDTYNQTVHSANIDAYYPQYGVTIHNELPTGQLLTPCDQSGHNGLPLFSVLLSAEVGYEWQIGSRYSRKSEQYIGLQLYADYGVWGTQTKQDAFLNVAAITAAYQHPKVTVGSIAAARSLQYFSAGLRLYYTIQSVDYAGRGWHRWRR